MFCLLLLAAPMSLRAAILDPGPTPVDSITAVNMALVNTLSARLTEISLIDKETLQPAERRALRKEVRSIKKQLKAVNNGGVYISVGSLLIVIILLILLL